MKRLPGGQHAQVVCRQMFMLFRVLTLQVILMSMLVAAAPAWANTMTGIVFVVIDGDTVLFKPDSPYSSAAQGSVARAFMKIRLANIDAPEKDQAYGDAATRELSALVLNQRVEVNTVAVDVYGRTIAMIQQGAVQVNTELVRRGLAWAYRSNAALKAMQRDAQQAQRGLWREPDPVPPWAWRREHSAVGY